MALSPSRRPGPWPKRSDSKSWVQVRPRARDPGGSATKLSGHNGTTITLWVRFVALWVTEAQCGATRPKCARRRPGRRTRLDQASGPDSWRLNYMWQWPWLGCQWWSRDYNFNRVYITFESRASCQTGLDSLRLAQGLVTLTWTWKSIMSHSHVSTHW